MATLVQNNVLTSNYEGEDTVNVLWQWHISHTALLLLFIQSEAVSQLAKIQQSSCVT